MEKVILIHGMAVNKKFFKYTENYLLKKEYEVFNIDYQSIKGLNINIFEWMLNNLIGRDRAHIIGHSLGSLIALYYGIQHAKKIKSLVLVNSDPKGFRKSEENMIKSSINLLKSCFSNKKKLHFKEIVRLFYHNINENKFNEIKEMISKNRVVNIVEQLFLLNYLRLKLNFKELRIPALVLLGENDPLVNKELVLNDLNNFKNYFVKTYKNTWHAIPYERPKKFHRDITIFLENQ